MAYDFSQIAVPDIVAAMQRDPRVLLAKQQMSDAGSTAPAYGGGGIARLLQGIVGGLGARAANNKYGDQQSTYMDEIKSKIAEVLGQGGTMPQRTDHFTAHREHQHGMGEQSPPPPPLADPNNAGIGQIEAIAPGAQGVMPLNPGASMPPPGGPPPPPQGPQMSVPPMPGGPPQAPQMQPPTMMPGGPGGPPPPQPGMPPQNGAMHPGMPAPPGAPQPLQSTRLKLGQALMGGKSPYSFNTGLQDVYAGLEEDAQNKALEQSRNWDITKAGYTAGVGDYYGAKSDERGAEYNRQSQERGFNHDDKQLRLQFDHQWLMQKDSQNFTANEGDKDRLFQTYKMIADTTGEVPTDLSNLTPDAVWGSIKRQESGGDSTPGDARGPQTKYGVALGSTQMLPGTAKEMADKLGVDFKPELLQANTPEALAYQNQLGRAYFNEGLEKYHGDFRKAAMYYHGGPDESKWGPKTRGYASEVLGRLPSGIASSVPQGQKALFGIDINGHQKKAVPTRVQGTLDTMADTATQLLNIRQSFDDNNFGYGSGIAGRAGMLFEEKVTGSHQDRVEWWKSYDMMNNIVRHSLFGSALTVGEQKQYERAIVDPGTKPAIARKRLDTQWSILQKAMERNARSASSAYNGRQVYEQIGGDDMADMIAHDKPLSGVTARANQVAQGGGIPKGTTLELPDAPQPRRQPAFRPSAQPSFIRPQQQPNQKPWWLQATVPGR